MHTKDLIGKEVLDTDINVIGKIIDVDFDIETFEVENIVVQRGNIQEKFSIKKTEDLIPVEFIHSIGDKVLLKDIFG